MADKKQDEPKAPESAADVIANAQKELGNTRDLKDAPPTPEVQDAANRLVDAARSARTIAQAEYPYMMYDQDGGKPPRIVHDDEEYNKAVDDGYDETPAVATRHGLGDESEQQRIKADALREAEKERAKEQAKKDLETAEQQREADKRAGARGRK